MIRLIPNILFMILLCAGVGFFIFNIRKLIRNIRLGKAEDVSDHKTARLKNMLRIALGQRKMVVRPVAGVLHIFVYAGFLIINIEMLEIIIDGIFGTHRVFAPLGNLYNGLIAAFEILALLVIVAIIVFWIRRYVLKINRFQKKELNGWAKKDASLILYAETTLMLCFLVMNAADYRLQQLGVSHYITAGYFL